MTTSAEVIENVAVKLDRPCLVRVKVLCDAAGVEKVIPVTKLFAFVVSVKLELMVNDVAVEDRVMLVPAMKFDGPNGMYPRALVMLTALNDVELNGTYPIALVMFAALNAVELNGV